MEMGSFTFIAFDAVLTTLLLTVSLPLLSETKRIPFPAMNGGPATSTPTAFTPGNSLLESPDMKAAYSIMHGKASVETGQRAKIAPTKLPSAVPYGLPNELKEYLETGDATNSKHKRRISLLGSTGSIGTQTLDIIESAPEHFELVGISAGGNIEKLAEQVKKFRPKIVAIRDEEKLKDLEAMLADMGDKKPIILAGEQGVIDVATHDAAETVVTGIVGYAGLMPTVKAIECGKHIALANKETLVAAGPVILPLLKKFRAKMTPADSEHSAIYQCMQGGTFKSIKKLILTASGGPFRKWTMDELKNVKLSDALKHPNYAMGAKITIDSATLMNKGLEVLEAHSLFGIDYDDIDVLVHPQSIVHSMVEYRDTSVIAQLGWPDMRLPLLYAMSWPVRMRTFYPSLDLAKVGSLTFEPVDWKKYPCLSLAYQAGRLGGTMPATLNAANEQAVKMFRNGQIHFLEIPKVCEFVMESELSKHRVHNISLEDIVEADREGRNTASRYHSMMI